MLNRKVVFIFIGFICLNFPAIGQSAVQISTDSNHVETGNPFVLHFSIPNTFGKPDSLRFGQWLGAIAPENILSHTKWMRNEQTYNLDLKLIFFDADTLNFPPMAVSTSKGDTLFSNAITVFVQATPSPDDLNDMAPIKDISTEPTLWTDYLTLAAWILGGAGIIALLFWWMTRRRESVAISRMMELPPHELALKKLAQLKKKNWWASGMYKEHCAELTFILREYIEKRFHAPALESTSMELLRHLKGSAFPADHLPDLENILTQSDLVKFAKGVPPESFYEYAMDFAHSLVKNTIPAPEEAAQNSEINEPSNPDS